MTLRGIWRSVPGFRRYRCGFDCGLCIILPRTDPIFEAEELEELEPGDVAFVAEVSHEDLFIEGGWVLSHPGAFDELDGFSGFLSGHWAESFGVLHIHHYDGVAGGDFLHHLGGDAGGEWTWT